MSAPLLTVLPEVAAALAAGAPVVALESTIVTHGMPFPANLETAVAVEAVIRAGGAVPATIAVIGGVVRIGLGEHDLHNLARSGGVLKLSRADLAFAVATRRTGSTTVAATMICAARAGIAVFATGGIGGVHRGAELSFDISADLTELARTDVAVVAAGAKALLDLPKTLELLETLGVPVVGYGTDDFPAFWSRVSGLRAPLRLDSPSDVARFIAARRTLGLGGGVLIANPVPAEAEISAAEMAPAIAQALAEAEAGGVSGKAVTPFVLARIGVLTAGRSLSTNIALIRNNARIAADIAVALAARSDRSDPVP